MTGKRRPPWSARQYRDEIVSAGDLLSPSCRLVALTLRDEFWHDGRGKISLTDLQGLTGLGRSTLCRNLTTLEDAGLLSRRTPSKSAQLGHGAKTHYTLHVSHDGTDAADVQAANVSHSGTSNVSHSGTRSVPPRHTLPKEEPASASARSRSAPRTSPRDTESMASHPYKPWPGFPPTHARHWVCQFTDESGKRCGETPPTTDNRHVGCGTPQTVRDEWNLYVGQSAPTPAATPTSRASQLPIPTTKEHAR